AWLYWNGSWIGNATIFIVLPPSFGEVIPSFTTLPTTGFFFCFFLFTYDILKDVMSIIYVKS
ncbi:hypothetical protein ACHM19_05435, partial [Clostridium perfringens]